VKKDYYSVLVRAVSALDPNSPEERRAVYDRARDAMAGAPLTPKEIERERFALEAAIRRIEADLASAGIGRWPAPSAAEAPPDDREDVQPRPPTASSRPARRPSPLLVTALAVAATLAVGFTGYQYWPKPGRDSVGTPVRAPARDVDQVRDASAPDDKKLSYIFQRQLVYYRSIHPAGTIVITKSQNFLYLTRPNTAALRYTIGIGRECSSVVGLLIVSAKEDWTGADPKNSANGAQPAVQIAGGRFGARSLALGDTGHRIHGSEEPVTGRVIGCFPLVNDDVIDLYERVALGARVVMN
jgi:lipoprotein-anchoring transpeptidase ErfK/SrfK